MDVIVIGGGIIGCAIARELALRGAQVRLLERRSPGAGASQASAGMLCPHLEGHDTAITPLTVASVGLYDAFVERVRGDSGRHVEFRRCGTLEVALDDREAAELVAIAEAHRAQGIAHTLLTGAQAYELEPALSKRVTAALLVPSHGYVRVAELTGALAAAAERRGVVFRDMTEVHGIEPSGAGLQVIAADERWSADAVVLAAGTWSGQVVIHSSPPAPMRPVRGQLLHLHTGQPVASRVIWSSGAYLVPWLDGSLLVGATSEDAGFSEDATVEGVSSLMRGACEVLPVVSSARLQAVRVGLRPLTTDGLPIIGRSSHVRGLVYATGHGRNGIMLAPLTATAVADLLLDGRESPWLAATSPARLGL
jgi:glycine oxidase